jgi:ADP-ribose pyrophosphatase YjhB (NUDIX family)
MKTVRTAARALILQQDKVLTIKMKGPSGVFYVLPGGGQKHGESLKEGLQRECREEIGVEVEIGAMVYCRDYIGKHHNFYKFHYDFHQLEVVFCCKVEFEKVKEMGESPDNLQVGVQWIPVAEVNQYPLYPSFLKEAIFNKNLDQIPAYLGDVN